MTSEERQIIADFIARISGYTPQQQSGAWNSSVPPTQQPPQAPLPAVDRDADQFIGEQFQRYPDARYRMTQLAFVQEHALIEAQNRIKRMEWELQQAQQQAQQSNQQPSGGGFFSGLFGGGRNQRSGPPPGAGPWGQGAPPPGYQQPGYGGYPPPPPQYPPGYNPGIFQRQGSGFLGSALTTAAGVAGGVLAADAIRDIFSGPHTGFGGGGGFASPWGGGAAGPEAGPAAAPDQGYVDSGTWDQGGGTWSDPASDPGNAGGADPGAWNDPSSGGWDQGGGSLDQGGGAWDQGGGGGSDDDSLI